MTDLASAELVRGPSSALYGANAFNGVLNLVTKAPKDMARRPDGPHRRRAVDPARRLQLRLRLSATSSTARSNAAYSEGDSFYIPRVTSVEYPGLARERVVGNGEYDSTHIQVRLDKYFNDGRQLATIEGGYYDSFGGVVVTGIGRVQLNDGERTVRARQLQHRAFQLPRLRQPPRDLRPARARHRRLHLARHRRPACRGPGQRKLPRRQGPAGRRRLLPRDRNRHRQPAGPSRP